MFVINVYFLPPFQFSHA